MANASVALSSARVYLNDVGAQMWTDTVLLPYLKEAFRDLLSILWLNGLPVIKEKSSTIPVPANSVTVGLPVDLIEPIYLKERPQGSNEDWIPMTECEFEPDRRREQSLIFWCWREQAIQLLGATTNREVLLRYWKTLTEPVDANSSLGFMFAENFIGPQTAAYAAGSVGNLTLAGELLYVPGQNVGVAGGKLDTILRANVRGQQSLPARRIPYRRFNRSRILL